MADFLLQGVVKLKDEFSAELDKIGKNSGASFAESMKSAAGDIYDAMKQIGPSLQSGFEVLTGNYSELGNVMRAIPGPIGEIGSAVGNFLGGAIEKTVEYTTAMGKLARTTGESVEFVSAFVQASDDMFVSQEAVNASLERFSRNLGGITDMEGGVDAAGKGVAKVLAEIGVNAADASGKLKPMSELLPQIADKFKSMPDGAEKTALAIALFGKRGAELIPILNQGRDGLNGMMEAAKTAGLVIDGTMVAAVDKLRVAQDGLNDKFDALKLKLGIQVIPVLEQTVSNFTNLLEVIPGVGGAFDLLGKGLQEFITTGKLTEETMAQIPNTIANIAEGLSLIVPAFGPVADALRKAADASQATAKAQQDLTVAAEAGAVATVVAANASIAYAANVDLARASVEATTPQAIALGQEIEAVGSKALGSVPGVDSLSGAIKSVPLDTRPQISVGGMLTASFHDAVSQFQGVQDRTVTLTAVTVRREIGDAPGRCFAAGTLIATPTGMVHVEHIRAGDTVLAFDHASNQVVHARVGQTSVRHAGTVIVESKSGLTVVCTSEHPFYVDGTGYVAAHALIPGLLVRTLTGAPQEVAAVIGWHECDVFNFEVIGHHNYYANGLLVHNASTLMRADDYAAINPRGVVHVTPDGRANTTNNYNLTIHSQARTEDVRANYEMMKLLARR